MKIIDRIGGRKEGYWKINDDPHSRRVVKGMARIGPSNWLETNVISKLDFWDVISAKKTIN